LLTNLDDLLEGVLFDVDMDVESRTLIELGVLVLESIANFGNVGQSRPSHENGGDQFKGRTVGIVDIAGDGGIRHEFPRRQGLSALRMNVNDGTFDGHGRLNLLECLAGRTFEFDSKFDVRGQGNGSEGPGSPGFRKGIEFLSMGRMRVQANGVLVFRGLARHSPDFHSRRDTRVGGMPSLKSPGCHPILILDGNGE